MGHFAARESAVLAHSRWFPRSGVLIDLGVTAALAVLMQIGQSQPVRLKVMADHQSWPLWREDIIDNVDPASLPISEALRLRLLEWAQKFDDILVWDDPASSKFASPDAEAALEAEGRELSADLQLELKAAATVRYWRDLDPGA